MDGISPTEPSVEPFGTSSRYLLNLMPSVKLETVRPLGAQAGLDSNIHKAVVRVLLRNINSYV